ncbi:MAG: LTA synthase family protein [Defluviitaleaceae bacterium]|nr:LTA synthase family protein [Defluviitaleaceae bacterium]
MIDKLSKKYRWEYTQWYPPIYTIVKILLYISLVLFPLYAILIIEYMNFRGSLALALEWRSRFPTQAFFGMLIVTSIFTVLLLLSKKAVIAGGILGLIAALMGYINYVKVAVNGDNFFPRDIAMAGSAGYLTSFVNIRVPMFFWIGIIVMIIWLVTWGLFNIEIPINWKVRIPIAVVFVVVSVIFLSSHPRAERFLNRFNMSFFDAALQSSNYEANGFVGAFTINLLSMNIERPEGYSRDTIMALLEGSPHIAATEDYFDVIVVLSEGFFDVRILPGVEFSENPLPNFDAIIARPNAYSGLVYTTALNGGTIRPEFDILTGLTTDFLPSGSIPYEFLRRPMATYVSHYRDAGYRTIALHPFTERFYMRHIAYPLMGFDQFLGYESLYQRFPFEYNQNFVTDISFFTAMEHYLDEALVDDVPIFMFAITMQNHQPFPVMAPEDIRIHVTSDLLDETVLNTVTTYTHGLADADTMLGMLVDYIDNRERPTIMLFFGDHLPNLGGHLAAFTQTGLIPQGTMNTPEARSIMYSTPFIIYSNRELTPIIPSTDNHISTYYLLSIMAYQTGFHRTPYMNLLLDYFRQIPFHNVRLNLPETDISQSLTRTKRLITYDRLIGREYSVLQ